MKEKLSMLLDNKVYKLFKNFIKKHIHCVYKYVINLDNLILDISYDFKLKNLSINDVDLIRSFYPSESDKTKHDLLLKRIDDKNKDVFCVIDKFENICGIFSLSYIDTFIYEINDIIHLNNEECYLFDDYTFIEHRRRGVQTFSVKARCDMAHKSGYKKAFVIVDKDNKPSRKSMENAGFKCEEKYYFITVKNFRKLLIILLV